MRARSLAAALLMVCVASLAAPARACPGCSRAIAEGDAVGGNASQGYAWSILLMMSAPFLITGTAGALMYRSWRRDRDQR